MVSVARADGGGALQVHFAMPEAAHNQLVRWNLPECEDEAESVTSVASRLGWLGRTSVSSGVVLAGGLLPEAAPVHTHPAEDVAKAAQKGSGAVGAAREPLSEIVAAARYGSKTLQARQSHVLAAAPEHSGGSLNLTMRACMSKARHTLHDSALYW
jgi:hypothetical protein